MTTPDHLRVELARLGVTRDVLARTLGVDRRTVYRWLSGETPIPRAVWLAMWALGGRKRPPPP